MKKDLRTHLRITDDMYRKIEALRHLHNRKFGDEMRHLLTIGLQHFDGKETNDERSLQMSPASEIAKNPEQISFLPPTPIGSKERQTSPRKKLA